MGVVVLKNPKGKIITPSQIRASAELERRARELREEASSWTLHQYIPLCWPIVEPTQPFVGNWHIDAIAEHLTAVTYGQIQHLIINIQPRHMKSLTTSVFWMTWAWTKYPELRWLFSSYGESLSIRDSIKCRRIITHPWYETRFGHLFSLVDDQNQKTRFDNNKTGYRIATSVGGAATGEGGDIIVVDDPIKLEDAMSENKREEVIEWWDGSMSTRHNDAATGRTVIIMQRTHANDLAGHVMKKVDEGGRHYETLILPTEFEPNRKSITALGWEDPRKKSGDLIWPERFSASFILSLKRELGPYKASAQLQQNPSPTGGGIFKSGWWKFWQPKGWNLGPVPVINDKGEMENRPVEDLPTVSEMAQTWDMSFKSKEANSHVSGQVWGFQGSSCYLLWEVHEHLDIVETIQKLLWLTELFPQALAKLIEDKANGPAVMQILKNEIPGMIPVNPMGDKVARAYAVQPLFWAGNVYLPHPDMVDYAWVRSYMEEFQLFPKGRSDRIDAASQLLALLLLPLEQRRLLYEPVQIGRAY